MKLFLVAQVLILPFNPYVVLTKLKKAFFQKLKTQKIRKVTIGSQRYFIEHQPQKVTALHSMGSTRL